MPPNISESYNDRALGSHDALKDLVNQGRENLKTLGNNKPKQKSEIALHLYDRLLGSIGFHMKDNDTLSDAQVNISNRVNAISDLVNNLEIPKGKEKSAENIALAALVAHIKDLENRQEVTLADALLSPSTIGCLNESIAQLSNSSQCPAALHR